MRKVLKTLKLVTFGGLALVIIGSYAAFAVIVSVAITFVDYLKEIWLYENND